MFYILNSNNSHGNDIKKNSTKIENSLVQILYSRLDLVYRIFRQKQNERVNYTHHVFSYCGVSICVKLIQNKKKLSLNLNLTLYITVE